jgi:hypothetical protein
MKEIKPKFPNKTEETMRNEFRNIMLGKDNSMRGRMLRNAGKALMIKDGLTIDQIVEYFVAEYKKKYADLQSGKKTLEDIKKESMQDIETLKTIGITP